MLKSNTKCMHHMIVDGSNLLYRAFYGTQAANTARSASIISMLDEEESIYSSDEDAIGLAINSALVATRSYFNSLKPNRVYMCFDGKSWRKEYTSSDQCISKKPYKGNRRKNMTPEKEKMHGIFIQAVDKFIDMMSKYTNLHIMRHDQLEADDIVSGLCQVFEHDKISIISRDNDFIQLLRNPNVQLIDPQTNKNLTLEEWDGDANYFMFMKCIRGDASDNVQSSYPGVRKTKINEAYTNEFARINMMKHEWQHDDGRTIQVEKLFNENKMLMDLFEQPENIKVMIFSYIDEKLSSTGKYDHMFMLRYLSQNNLNQVCKNIETYIPLLTANK